VGGGVDIITELEKASLKLVFVDGKKARHTTLQQKNQRL